MNARWGLLLVPVGLAIFSAGCDHASFTYVDNDRPPPPPRRVTVVERRPPTEVHVIEERPVREVHVHHAPPREVHVVEKHPVTEVHVHHDHCCTASCNHYWNGAKFVVVKKGHRHGPGCGHHFDGRRWSISVGKTKP